MKVADECYACLAALLRQAAELATADAELKARVIEQGQRLLDSLFAADRTSISVATPLHRLVREMTGNADPYLPMKEAEVRMARQLQGTWAPELFGGVGDCLVLAVRGNNIDFFKDLESIEAGMSTPVAFAIDHVTLFEDRLHDANTILYLADNSGEVIFDIPLFRKLGEFGEVTYVVKESPVQNDITLQDLSRFGLAGEFDRVITTGTDTPGVDMDLASDEFKAAFEAADLVLAKGMGYWETLSELPPGDKVLHLLRAKCQPVADSLGVPLDSYVALLR